MDSTEIEAGRKRWQERYDAAAKREADFTTLSGIEVEPGYGPPAGVSFSRLAAVVRRTGRAHANELRPDGEIADGDLAVVAHVAERERAEQ